MDLTKLITTLSFFIYDLTIKQAWKLIVGVVGFTILALGAVMLVTPGPGILIIGLGLIILATEFVWAKRLLKSVKEKYNSTFHPHSAKPKDVKSPRNK